MTSHDLHVFVPRIIRTRTVYSYSVQSHSTAVSSSVSLLRLFSLSSPSPSSSSLSSPLHNHHHRSSSICSLLCLSRSHSSFTPLVTLTAMLTFLAWQNPAPHLRGAYLAQRFRPLWSPGQSQWLLDFKVRPRDSFVHWPRTKPSRSFPGGI